MLDECLVNSTIMIIDDTPANLKLLHRMLGDLGFKVVAFSSGSLAIKGAKLNPPDLVLLDINMPDMNGYEVCKRFKEDLTLEKIPIIFISALNEVLDKIQAFQTGGVDYITNQAF